jgi:hypothetical protein
VYLFRSTELCFISIILHAYNYQQIRDGTEKRVVNKFHFKGEDEGTLDAFTVMCLTQYFIMSLTGKKAYCALVTFILTQFSLILSVWIISQCIYLILTNL